jgi:hypothetical protein
MLNARSCGMVSSHALLTISLPPNSLRMISGRYSAMSGSALFFSGIAISFSLRMIHLMNDSSPLGSRVSSLRRITESQRGTLQGWVEGHTSFDRIQRRAAGSVHLQTRPL